MLDIAVEPRISLKVISETLDFKIESDGMPQSLVESVLECLEKELGKKNIPIRRFENSNGTMSVIFS